MGKIIRNGIEYGGSYTLPPASANVLGGIKVGSGLSITSDGTLSATGGGGSTGELVLGEKTLAVDSANPSSEDVMIPSNFVIDGSNIPFLDIYKLDFRGLQATSIAVTSDSDQEDYYIMIAPNIVISDIISLIRLYKLPYGDTSFIGNADKHTVIELDVNKFTWSGAGSLEYTAQGTFHIRIGWEYNTGLLSSMRISGPITKITSSMDSYTPSGGSVNYTFSYLPGLLSPIVYCSGYGYYII